MAITLHPSFAVHPGEWLRSEIVEPHGLTVTDGGKAARHAAGEECALERHAGLSAEMAIRFEKAFGLKADTMLRMQTAKPQAQVRAREREIVVDRVAA